MKKINICISLFLVVVVYSSCNDSGNSTTTNTTTNSTINGDTSNDKNKITEVVNLATGIKNDVVDTKRRNDSIRNANKDRMWVYQIGSQMDDEEIAEQMYDKLKDIKNIYIFKKSKNEYYLIKDDSYSTQQQLLDSMGSVKNKIASVTTDRVEPIDLSLQCSSKKQPTRSPNLKYKSNGQKKEVECRTCE